MIVVRINDGGGARLEQNFEQAKFRFEIRFQARMVIEMIARDIGEAARGDAQTVEPRLVEAVRGRLDRQMRDAFAGECVDRTVQRDGVGRRQRAVSFTARRNDTDRADACGAMTERGPDLPCERSDRRLAAGAGDGGNGARLTRIKFCGDERERAPRAADTHERDILRQRRLRALLGNDGGGARGDGGADETETVGFVAGNGDEEAAPFDGAAIRRHAADVEIGVCASNSASDGKISRSFIGARSTAFRSTMRGVPYLFSFVEASIS